MKKKVVCVYGSFEEDDFVLEPVCVNKDCQDCNENAFWIEKVEAKE